MITSSMCNGADCQATIDITDRLHLVAAIVAILVNLVALITALYRWAMLGNRRDGDAPP